MAIVAAMVVVHAAAAHAQSGRGVAASPERDDVEHSIVWELGWAADWSPGDGVHHGATIAFELEPIEGWLEVEVGFTALRADDGFELPVDVLFKKPWRFSPQFEFMVGAGPELIHTTGPDHETVWGVSAVLDFMFWPRKNVGWYVEPGYEAAFRGGAQHGFAVAAGLLIGRPARRRSISPRSDSGVAAPAR